jgi:POT family proton-dependent oligopeptide transporter
MATSLSSAPDQGGSIFGHKPGLFVLFFTEMWERFSYYGMRALLVLFLVQAAFGEGPWERSEALELYAIYTGFVYFTPMLGGIIADRFLGYRKAVVLGAFVMTLGHAAMAVETEYVFYLGLLLLIIGNGLFKPNISSIVGQLYTGEEERKDGAYTIFYMGINSGAFLGILLCGYFGEQWGWSWGFGLAGVFMLFGLIQFWLAQNIFGKIGLAPSDEGDTIEEAAKVEDELIQVPKGTDITGSNSGAGRITTWAAIAAAVGIVLYFLTEETIAAVIFATVIGFIGWIVSDPTLKGIEKDRVWVIVILSFFIVFFWWAFEQAGGSMTIFAADYTERNLTGSGADIYWIANTLITVLPMAVLTYVLVKLFNITFTDYSASNIVLGLAFVIVWILVGIMLYEQFSAETTEVPASWFQIFNSLFIICFAPLFSKLWERKVSWLNSWPVKFALGLTLLGLGFAILAFGAMGIPEGAKTASVSMFWLIAAYLLHTLGELCISPVGLSYVSKLAPIRLVGLMFGVFFVANFVANYAAGKTGSYIDPIAEAVGISGFFLIFAAVPIVAAVVLILIKGWVSRMMHGIE